MCVLICCGLLCGSGMPIVIVIRMIFVFVLLSCCELCSYVECMFTLIYHGVFSFFVVYAVLDACLGCVCVHVLLFLGGVLPSVCWLLMCWWCG